MRTLASEFSDEGKAALKGVADIILSSAGGKEMIEQAAFELALENDSDAEAALRKTSRELVDLMKRDYPTLLKHPHGIAIAICEMIAARVNDLKAREGHA